MYVRAVIIHNMEFSSGFTLDESCSCLTHPSIPNLLPDLTLSLLALLTSSLESGLPEPRAVQLWKESVRVQSPTVWRIKHWILPQSGAVYLWEENTDTFFIDFHELSIQK